MSTPLRPRHSLGHASGVTLIELMIAMTLGLVVIGGVTNIIMSSSQAHRANQGLAAIQDNARTAMEMLARDIRESGATPCGEIAVSNSLNNRDASGNLEWWADDDLWSNWRANGFRAFDGSLPGARFAFIADGGPRLPGTHAIRTQSVTGTTLTVEDHEPAEEHKPASANIKLSEPKTVINEGDILMVCDLDHAAVFQATNYISSNITLVHNTGSSVTPGNCSTNLSFPRPCDSDDKPIKPDPPAYTFPPHSAVTHANISTWFVRQNNHGGSSLYRARVASVTDAQEIIPNVSDMQVRVRTDEGLFVAAPYAGVAWANVNAVEITLTLYSDEGGVAAGGDPNNANRQGRLSRNFTTIVALRNRIQ